MNSWYDCVGNPLRSIASAFIIFLNPITCILAIHTDIRATESVWIVSLLGIVSVGVAIWWSKLLLQPVSRLADWLSLLILYGVLSAVIQTCLPLTGSIVRKGQLLVPALIATVWGAAWSWRYFEILNATTFVNRLRLLSAGILFVVGFPLCVWLTVAIVASQKDQSFKWPAFALVTWGLSALATIPGFIVSKRVQDKLNPPKEIPSVEEVFRD